MQFLVVARDGTDDEAIERRRRVRPSHLEAIAPLVEDGHVLVGGAILSGTGEMIGSMLLVDFPEPEDVHEWLARDPYVTGGVWRDIEVSPFRSAVGAWHP
ncbi:MAG TPA: YciI family protein [Actinomycetota bacterium]|nr:YciI family protein [Actinomycetota bacterium]